MQSMGGELSPPQNWEDDSVTRSVTLGVHSTSQVKFCLITIPLCRTCPATHVIFCKGTERMKAVCGAKMIKQISRTSFSSASKIVLRLLVILVKTNKRSPATLRLHQEALWVACIALRVTRFLSQRKFCHFKRSERNVHYNKWWF